MALARLFGNGQPETKDPYGAPGSGKSNFISAVTIVVILLGWWLATELELVRALFLPSPGLVFSKFLKIACYDHYKEAFLVFLGVQAEVVAECEGFSENALHQHILWSLYRVFSSFLLAVVTAIPIGIAMGMNRIARGVFDPPIEFYRPIPPLSRRSRSAPGPACAPARSSRSTPPTPWAPRATRCCGTWCSRRRCRRS
jgi:taurine transport system permease protein